MTEEEEVVEEAAVTMATREITQWLNTKCPCKEPQFRSQHPHCSSEHKPTLSLRLDLMTSPSSPLSTRLTPSGLSGKASPHQQDLIDS